MSTPNSRTNTIRLVVRQVQNLQLTRTQNWRAQTGLDPLAGVVFAIVLSGSIAHLPLVDPVTGNWVTIDDAPTAGRAVTATAIAQSMQFPATSARRRANELVAGGLLERVATGFRANPAFVNSAICDRWRRENVAHLANVLASLAASGHEPAIRALAAVTPAMPPSVIERVMIAFELRVMETMTQLYGDLVTAHLYSAIIVANVRHIIDDPALARRYGSDDSIPPDGERRPVTLRVLARAVDMPFETVRRRVMALIAAGTVVQHDAGVFVPNAVLAQDRYGNNNERIAGFFDQMLETLIAAAARQ